MKKTLFETALDQAAQVIAHVQPDMYSLPTPCAEWDLRRLLNHLYYELAWVPELLAGKTIEQVGDALDGDLVGDDPHRAWHTYAETARKAAATTPPETVVHLSYGNRPAREYLDEVGGDIVVHLWDVAKAIKQPFTIPEPVAEVIYDRTKDQIDEWRKIGLIGEPTPLPPHADAQAKLLSLFGR
jgi:uncharacterized protein (TIGR03086 family)